MQDEVALLEQTVEIDLECACELMFSGFPSLVPPHSTRCRSARAPSSPVISSDG